MQQLKYIFKYLLSLITEPEQTWRYLTEKDVEEAKHEYMLSNYYLPMMGVISVLLFLMNGWGSTFDIEHAIKAAFIFLASYFAGPYLADVILRFITDKWMHKSLDKEKLMVFVCYSMSFLMFVEVLAATFPSIRFISFCALYLVYIVWCASDIFFVIEEKIRWKFTTIAFFVIWGSPIIIGKIMSFMIS